MEYLFMYLINIFYIFLYFYISLFLYVYISLYVSISIFLYFYISLSIFSSFYLQLFASLLFISCIQHSDNSVIDFKKILQHVQAKLFMSTNEISHALRAILVMNRIEQEAVTNRRPLTALYVRFSYTALSIVDVHRLICYG